MTPPDVVFLLDVDNTLFESDRVKKEFRRYLESELGDAKRFRFLAIVEEWRPELGGTDYLGARQRYRP